MTLNYPSKSANYDLNTSITSMKPYATLLTALIKYTASRLRENRKTLKPEIVNTCRNELNLTYNLYKLFARSNYFERCIKN